MIPNIVLTTERLWAKEKLLTKKVNGEETRSAGDAEKASADRPREKDDKRLGSNMTLVAASRRRRNGGIEKYCLRNMKRKIIEEMMKNEVIENRAITEPFRLSLVNMDGVNQ